ncbi:hypothetical protein QE152_g26638 [Popillia japonica]|uniref:Uncharacterized protein n=1 Tax=Popillia japonica TaxID=7064 RepID=A0AAW1JX84_POPJA
MQEEIEELRHENKQLKQENKDIKKALKEIRDEGEQIRKEKKKNNVVENSDPEALKNMTKRIIKHIGVEVKIKSAAKIGHKTCLLELEDQGDKEEILRNKFKLKNVRNERIYINDDLTRNEREQQRQMRKNSKTRARKGQYSEDRL